MHSSFASVMLDAWHAVMLDAQKQLACMFLSSNQVHQFECSREKNWISNPLGPPCCVSLGCTCAVRPVDDHEVAVDVARVLVMCV